MAGQARKGEREMTSDLDPDAYCTANLLIEKRGDLAQLAALTMAVAAFAKGDERGWERWRRVAVRDLQSKARGGAVH